MNGDQKLDVYDQAREKFVQHFPQIVKVLTEDDVKCTDAEDAVARLREVRDVQSEGVNLRSLCMCGIQLWCWGNLGQEWGQAFT